MSSNHCNWWNLSTSEKENHRTGFLNLLSCAAPSDCWQCPYSPFLFSSDTPTQSTYTTKSKILPGILNETLRSKTFDFKSETRPRPSKIFSRPRPSILGLRPKPRRSGPTPRHFSIPYMQVNCIGLMLFFDDTSSVHTLILHKWNRHHKSSWHCQEFTQHIFSNQIGRLSLYS